jgi:hypothetical protein
LTSDRWEKRRKIMSKMPRRKYLVMLYFLEVLLEKGIISKEDLLCQLDISEISFKRYIGCLREYLVYAHPTWRIAFRRSHFDYELFKGVK